MLKEDAPLPQRKSTLPRLSFSVLSILMRDKREPTQANARQGGLGADDWSADDLRVTLGVRLRKARIATGLSQQAIADAMNERGFSWRQTTVAKTEAADRPVLFPEVLTLSQILGRDLNYFLTNRIALDDLKDQLARDIEAARERVRLAEETLYSARVEESRIMIQQGVALAITEYTYTGDSGPLRRSVDVFTDSPLFTLDLCMKVLNTAGIPRELVKEIDWIAMREAALSIQTAGRSTSDALAYGLKQEDVVQEARKFLLGDGPHPLFLRLLRDEVVYKGYAGQLLVDLVAEKVELRDA